MWITQIRKKTHLIIWGFAIIFGISIFYGYGSYYMGKKSNPAGGKAFKYDVPDSVVSVDGKKVSLDIFNFEYMKLKRNYEMMYNMKIDSYQAIMMVRSQVMEMMITQQLLLEEAAKRGLKADSAEVNKRIEQEMNFYIGPATEETGLKKVLAKNEREKQFKEILSRQGLTYDLFKTAIKREVLQAKAIDAIAADKKKSEEKNALKKAEDVLKKLNAGEPFANVAREFSDDEATKNNGGSLGWLKRGVLSKPVEDAAFALQPGQVSPKPVLADDGYHILLLGAKREAKGPEFEAAKPGIIKQIRESKGDETLKVSDDQIKKEYEAFAAAQILIRIKPKEQIASEWLKKEREGGKHKIVEINPEMKAYRYLYKAMFDPTAKTANPDEAIKLYEKAAAVETGNPWPHYELANIYKMKNGEAVTKKTESNPYEAAKEQVAKEEAVKEGKKAKDDNKYLKEAERELKEAKEIAVASSVYDPLIFLALADLAKSLGDHNVAIENYADALDTSAAGNKPQLEQIKAGLTGYKSEKAKKALKDAEELLAEIDAAEKERAAQEAAAQQQAAPVQAQPVQKSQPVQIQEKDAQQQKPAAAGQKTGAVPMKVIGSGSFVVGGDKKQQAAQKTTAATKTTTQKSAPATKPATTPPPAPQTPPAPTQTPAPEEQSK